MSGEAKMTIEILVEIPRFPPKTPKKETITVTVDSERLGLRIAEYARANPGDILCLGGGFSVPVRMAQVKDDNGLGKVSLGESQISDNDGNVRCSIGPYIARAAVPWPKEDKTEGAGSSTGNGSAAQSSPGAADTARAAAKAIE
ncbi:MAG: hypothetical protein HYV63_28405 [Candidatus Schekmanbacteria bacterium]|nr:hypothetical protein [Candidatus Schekmanbacteria bacterium]